MQWLIENYFTLYEEADLKLATTEPVFQRKMVGHTKSVLGTYLLDILLFYIYVITFSLSRSNQAWRGPSVVL